MREWLVNARKAQNITQGALASRVGVTRQMVTAIEIGVATPSVKVAKAIAEVLGIGWTSFFEDNTTEVSSQ